MIKRVADGRPTGKALFCHQKMRDVVRQGRCVWSAAVGSNESSRSSHFVPELCSNAKGINRVTAREANSHFQACTPHRSSVVHCFFSVPNSHNRRPTLVLLKEEKRPNVLGAHFDRRTLGECQSPRPGPEMRTHMSGQRFKRPSASAHNLDLQSPKLNTKSTYTIMNALANSMQKTLFQAGRRFASTTTRAATKAPFVPVRAASAKRLIFAQHIRRAVADRPHLSPGH
jgi:hypothetical protein